MTHYKGFEIGRYFDIFKNGNPVFTARHQRCLSLDQAKQIIDTSLAFKPLPDKQSALAKMTGECELENGSQDIADFAERVNNYFSNELEKQENDN